MMRVCWDVALRCVDRMEVELHVENVCVNEPASVAVNPLFSNMYRGIQLLNSVTTKQVPQRIRQAYLLSSLSSLSFFCYDIFSGPFTFHLLSTVISLAFAPLEKRAVLSGVCVCDGPFA